MWSFVIGFSFSVMFSRFIPVVTCVSTSCSCYVRIICHCMVRLHFVFPFISCRYLSCFHFLAIMSNVSINIFANAFVWTCFHFSVYSGMGFGSDGNSV